MFKGYPARFAQFVGRLWSSVIVAASILGLIAAHAWAPLFEYQDAFLPVVLTAIGVLLIDMRQKLEERAQRGTGLTTYRTMREARSLLLQLMIGEICRAETTEILIKGGRLRSIIEIMRELCDNLDGKRATDPTTIKIYMVSPAYLRALTLPGDVSEEGQRDRNAKIAAQMEAAVEEIARLNNHENLRNSHVAIELEYYEEIPWIYYFIIGNDNIVFGGYTWHKEDSDVDGPGSPCWHVTSSDAGFETIRFWLRNRSFLNSAQADAYKADAS